MKIRYFSDIHFEFHRDQGKSFVAALPRDCDVVVLAGDIGVAQGGSLLAGMRLLLNHYAGLPVLYVPGNHEFYAQSPQQFWSAERARRKAQEKVRSVCERLSREHSNFVGGVDPWTHEHGGVRFVGATMWFGTPPPLAPTWGMSDYQVIPGFDLWISQESARHLAYLGNHVAEDSIVVTHHLPHPDAVSPEYALSPLNPFFVHPQAPRIIEELRPYAWIHGHSHSSLDVHVGPTNLLRNPLGYVGKDECTDFNCGAPLTFYGE